MALAGCAATWLLTRDTLEVPVVALGLVWLSVLASSMVIGLALTWREPAGWARPIGGAGRDRRHWPLRRRSWSAWH